MTDDVQAYLAAFGLAVNGDPTLTRVTTILEVAGVTQWLAPELLDPYKATIRKTPAGDVFAFG
jgi:hypothetical protein